MSGTKFVFYILLALWAGLFGLFSITNLRVEWGPTIMGFAAVAVAVICIIILIRKSDG